MRFITKYTVNYIVDIKVTSYIYIYIYIYIKNIIFKYLQGTWCLLILFLSQISLLAVKQHISKFLFISVCGLLLYYLSNIFIISWGDRNQYSLKFPRYISNKILMFYFVNNLMTNVTYQKHLFDNTSAWSNFYFWNVTFLFSLSCLVW